VNKLSSPLRHEPSCAGSPEGHSPDSGNPIGPEPHPQHHLSSVCVCVCVCPPEGELHDGEAALVVVVVLLFVAKTHKTNVK